MHFLVLIILSVIDNGQKTCIYLNCISNIAYIANKLEFSYFAAMLDAILDFSAFHKLCKFMPAVSFTTDNTEHFDI